MLFQKVKEVKKVKISDLFTIVMDIKMHYVVYSYGKLSSNVDTEKPTLLVLHGGPGIVDHQIEVPAWRNFSPPMQVIFLDQRGNGKTEDGDPAKWNLKQCGEDVYQFCLALGLEHPIIAGVSWGGYVAMAYAALYPEHPSGLIFCNTEARVSIEERRKTFELLGGKEVGDAAYAYDQNPHGAGHYEKFIEKCLPYFSQTSFKFIEPFRVNMAMRNKFIAEENHKFNYLDTLKKIQCPTLILAGDLDPVHPIICAKETASCIPKNKLTFCLIQGAGAPIYQDQQEKFSHGVKSFLNKICSIDDKPSIRSHL